MADVVMAPDGATIVFPSDPQANQTSDVRFRFDGENWIVSSATDAPVDNQIFGRKNAGWVNITNLWAPITNPNFTGVLRLNGQNLVSLLATQFAPIVNPQFTGTMTLNGIAVGGGGDGLPMVPGPLRALGSDVSGAPSWSTGQVFFGERWQDTGIRSPTKVGSRPDDWGHPLTDAQIVPQWRWFSDDWVIMGLNADGGVYGQATGLTIRNPKRVSGPGLYAAFYADYIDPTYTWVETPAEPFPDPERAYYCAMQANGPGSLLAQPLGAALQSNAPGGLSIINLSSHAQLFGHPGPTRPLILYSDGQIAFFADGDYRPWIPSMELFDHGGLELNSDNGPWVGPWLWMWNEHPQGYWEIGGETNISTFRIAMYANSPQYGDWQDSVVFETDCDGMWFRNWVGFDTTDVYVGHEYAYEAVDFWAENWHPTGWSCVGMNSDTWPYYQLRLQMENSGRGANAFRASVWTDSPAGLWIQNVAHSPAGGIHFSIGEVEMMNIFEDGLHVFEPLAFENSWHDDNPPTIRCGGQKGLDIAAGGEMMLGSGSGLLLLTATTAPHSSAVFLLGNNSAQLIADSVGNHWAGDDKGAGKITVFWRGGKYWIANQTRNPVHLNDMMFKNAEV